MFPRIGFFEIIVILLIAVFVFGAAYLKSKTPGDK
jgi:Sec-independent protein translocase protein TatA